MSLFCPRTTRQYLPINSQNVVRRGTGKHWSAAFRSTAVKMPLGASEQKSFLVRTAAARQDGPKIPNGVQLELRPAATELIKSGCDDPLVQTELIQVVSDNSVEYRTMKQKLVERFMASKYPPHIAFLVGCPNLSAEQLINLQNARGIADSENIRSPFDVADPTDQRIVLEMFLSRYNLQMRAHISPAEASPIGISLDKTGLAVLQALGTNQPNSPWLKNMLLAYFARFQHVGRIFDDGSGRQKSGAAQSGICRTLERSQTRSDFHDKTAAGAKGTLSITCCFPRGMNCHRTQSQPPLCSSSWRVQPSCRKVKWCLPPGPLVPRRARRSSGSNKPFKHNSITVQPIRRSTNG